MSLHQTNSKTNDNEIMPKIAIDEDDKENYNGNDYETTTTSNINGVIEASALSVDHLTIVHCHLKSAHMNGS